MQRLQSYRQFNKTLEKRARRDELIERIDALFKSNGIDAKSIRHFDPSLSPSEISYLFSDDICRLGISRLERIKNTIRAAIDIGVAA